MRHGPSGDFSSMVGAMMAAAGRSDVNRLTSQVSKRLETPDRHSAVTIRPEIGDRVRPARLSRDHQSIVTTLQRYGAVIPLPRLQRIAEEYGPDVLLRGIEACGEENGTVDLILLRPFVESFAVERQRLDNLQDRRVPKGWR